VNFPEAFLGSSTFFGSISSGQRFMPTLLADPQPRQGQRDGKINGLFITATINSN
jgi:hypothetical protein